MKIIRNKQCEEKATSCQLQIISDFLKWNSKASRCKEKEFIDPLLHSQTGIYEKSLVVAKGCRSEGLGIVPNLQRDGAVFGKGLPTPHARGSLRCQIRVLLIALILAMNIRYDIYFFQIIQKFSYTHSYINIKRDMAR